MFNYSEVEDIIGYKFNDKEILLRAFTHSSFSKENNERLEFLGDSVLQVIISNYLFNESAFDEGVLSKYRAKIVCEENLYNAILKLGLQKHLILGDSYKSEPSKAMCADLCESIIGAIYLDSENLQDAKKFIFANIDLNLSLIEDFKSTLQEIVQSKGINVNEIKYDTISLCNDDGQQIFKTTLYICGEIYGTGEGRTKKEAEKNTAKGAIKKIK
ncbi:MAG: ribonuclease III [Christensenellales bacterium]